MDALTLAMRAQERQIALDKAEAAGRVADSMDVRVALMRRVKAGEISLEAAQAELRRLQRNAKKLGLITRAKAYKGK